MTVLLQVVDGISVSVNLVYVTVSSRVFTASFQMSRILLESKTPSWQKVPYHTLRVPTLPPLPLRVATAGKNHLNEEITPLLTPLG